jgi:hypothetical protein
MNSVPANVNKLTDLGRLARDRRMLRRLTPTSACREDAAGVAPGGAA